MNNGITRISCREQNRGFPREVNRCYLNSDQPRRTERRSGKSDMHRAARSVNHMVVKETLSRTSTYVGVMERRRSRRSFVTGAVAGFLALGWAALGHAQTPAIPDVVAKALANPARPDADRKQDSGRKPGELISFAGLKPGDRILELVPGSGYFTRIFSNVVGPTGYVYELVSMEEVKTSAKAADPLNAIAADPAFPGVSVFTQPIAAFRVPEPVDMVWTTQNYHDLHDKAFGPADIPAFNKAVFDALKPGGVFFVVDHAAAAGDGTKDTETLHRIDPAAAKSEIEAAGFVLEAQSDMLRNPDDNHTLRIFDPAIRGKTDKFIFRFRKPLTAK
jgi:predicted methyltransferase